MNPFAIIEWVLSIGPKVVDLGVRIARAVQPKPKQPASTWDRPHYWTVIDLDAERWVYACQWCGTPMPPNALTLPQTKCPGPHIGGQSNAR